MFPDLQIFIDKETTMLNFWLIVTHYWTHLDEMVATCLLRHFGAEMFPGIAEATIAYDDAGAPAPACLRGSGKHSALRKGVVPVGLYEQSITPFNEHADDAAGAARGRSGKKECAASLVYRYLKLDDPRLATLVEYTRQIDTRGGATATSMAEVLKLLNSQHSDYPRLVMAWAIEGIRAWFASNQTEVNHLEINFIAGLMEEGLAKKWLRFGNEALAWKEREFEEAKKIIDLSGDWRVVETLSGKPLSVLMIESGNSRVGAAGTAHFKADVVVVRKPTGQTGVFTRKKAGLQLGDLAIVVNLFEQQAGGKIEVTDWQQLRRRGSIPNGRWHYPEGMEILLNGGNSAPCAPATRLTLDEVFKAITIALGSDFHQSCDGKSCWHSPQRRCPWYKFGLQRCRDVRGCRYQERSDGSHEPGRKDQPRQPSAPTGNRPFVDLRSQMAAK